MSSGLDAFPMVRVVTLAFNGGQVLIDCLRAVLATEWPIDRLQVVCIDNGSTDGRIEQIEREMPSVRIIRNGANLGFPGNNTALRDLDGVDFVALVNSDAFVDPDWLVPAVRRAMADPGVGAVCPKILFADRFAEISVSVDGGSLSRPPLALRRAEVDGVDVFARVHVAGGGGRSADAHGPLEWIADRSVIRVPIPDGSIGGRGLRVALELESTAHVRCRLGDDESTVAFRSVGDRSRVEIVVSDTSVAVLNNVGSWLDQSWTGHERGLREVDRGQFDESGEVGTWCGAAVLLRSDHLADVGVFEESFFLYYEDTDLAVRGRARGWRFVTEPTSIVRHVHSASTVEGSAIASHYIERNRLLLIARQGPARTLLREVFRFKMVTLSYLQVAIRDGVARRRRPDLTTVLRRMGSLWACTRLLPSAFAQRRHLRRSRLISAATLTTAIAQGATTNGGIRQ